MVLMMGLRGSGKSTFYSQRLAGDFVRVNLDSLKTRRNENRLLESCFAQNLDFAVDNTNPTRAERRRYIEAAKAHGYRIVGYFMESKLRACLARNALREGAARLPARALAATSNRLEMPSRSEGFDELYFVANDGKTMQVSPWRENDEI